MKNVSIMKLKVYGLKVTFYFSLFPGEFDCVTFFKGLHRCWTIKAYNIYMNKKKDNYTTISTMFFSLNQEDQKISLWLELVDHLFDFIK